jgi:hypothetical protein
LLAFLNNYNLSEFVHAVLPVFRPGIAGAGLEIHYNSPQSFIEAPLKAQRITHGTALFYRHGPGACRLD